MYVHVHLYNLTHNMQLFINGLVYRECFSEFVSSVCIGTIAQIAIPLWRES